MPRVLLPLALRDHSDGAAEISVEASTVAHALASLVDRHPGMRRHLYDDSDRLRGYVNIYVNEDEVRTLPRRMDTAIRDGDVIMIIPSIAGG